MMTADSQVGSITTEYLKAGQGKLARKAISLIALSLVLVLVVPAAATAQFVDPILEQYAPSTQQVNEKVKEGRPDDSGRPAEQGGDGQEVQPGGASEQLQPGGVAGNDGGNGGQGGQGGNSGDVQQASGDRQTEQGPDAKAAAGGGFDDRVVEGLPFTSFDLIVIVLVAAAVTGAGVVLRRLSRPPAVGD
jgi:hypothetical protein